MENVNKKELYDVVDVASVNILMNLDMLDLLYTSLSDLHTSEEPMSGFARQQINCYLTLLHFTRDRLKGIADSLETVLKE